MKKFICKVYFYDDYGDFIAIHNFEFECYTQPTYKAFYSIMRYVLELARQFENIKYYSTEWV